MSIRINIDVGGTHTDTYLILNGRTATGKAETTTYNLSVGFMNSVADAAEKLGLSLAEAVSDAEVIKYSTTIGTNALIERTGPKLGLITTRGFEETIHIGRAKQWADGVSREEIIDKPRGKRPEPLIPRELIVGIKERIDCFGNIIMPLKKEEVLQKVQYLVDKGVRGFVISLLWSFINPIHELQIRDIILEEYPDIYLGNMPIFLSSEASPKICEYKRSITTILDAYLRNEVEEHFIDLSDELRRYGHKKPLMVVRNAGGVASASRTRPIHLYGSGPVAGIMGGAFIGKLYGYNNIIVTDMGGTSFDIGMVVEGKERVYEFEPIVDRWRLAFPIIASTSVGAGGGSIARIDLTGRLAVGPDSAGAMPGPACYDKGGLNPTVTDADVVLGYIDPGYFLGGRQKLSRQKAHRAIERKIAEPLGLDVEMAAFRIKKLIDGFMGQEIYKQTAQKGYDPREFVLSAFGGAGPVHCSGFAEYADVDKIITFPFASVFNSFGAATMDIFQTYEKSKRFTLYEPTSQSYTADYDGFNSVIAALKNLALKDMEEEGFDLSKVAFQLELDMTYAQQIHSTRFTSPLLAINCESDVKAICDAFNQSYADTYGKAAIFPEGGIIITAFKLNAVAALPKPAMPSFSFQGADPLAALKVEREVFWDEVSGFKKTKIYELGLLKCGNAVSGPAIIEAPDTVYVIPAGKKFTVDKYLNGLIERT